MTIPTRIVGVDPSTFSDTEATVHARQGHAGMVVYSEELHEKTTILQPFLNDNFGANLAINGAFGGTPLVIHNGGDTVAWDGSNIQGNKPQFANTQKFNSGTQSIKVDNPAVGDIWQFDNFADVDLSDYAAISGYIYIDKDYKAGDSIAVYAYDISLGATVGATVHLEDYVDINLTKVWQTFVIPLTDINAATGVDSFRMEVLTREGGKSPKLYLDDLQLEETGDPVFFEVRPNIGKILYVTGITYNFRNDVDMTLADASVPALNPNAMLSAPALTNGISFRLVEKNITVFNTTFRNIGDILVAGGKIKDNMHVAGNTMVTTDINFDQAPVKLTRRLGDKMQIIVNDDLTGITSIVAMLRGYQIDDHAVIRHVVED